MKRKITLLCLLAFLCLIPHVSGQCTYGTKNPSYAHNPVYDQNEYLIMEDAHPGEYMMINTFSTATIYKFRSSQPTDYITITDAAGAQIFASGLNGSAGLNFTPPYPQPVRFYIHANAQCESNPFSTRTRFLKTTTVTYPCDSPHSLAVSNITSNSGKISWNAPIIGQNSSFEVYANTTGIAPVANTNPSAVAAGSTNAQLSGLTAGTAHYYWVRSFCTANSGVWVPGGTFNTLPAASCNGAPYGLYPEEMVQVPCNGMVQQITETAYAGEYSNVLISSGAQYTFSSSVATDFITITDPTGATVYTSGQSPLVWINNSNWGSIRYYLHSNSSCGSLMANRIKYIKCGGDVSGGCTDGDLHPSATFTPACTGSLELVSNNSWGGEYSNINVAANKQYTFSTSVSSDYVTIVNPTGNTVLATGPSPLTWTSGTSAMTIKYYLHTNANCGSQSINRQRYIKCVDIAPPCGAPTSLAISNITSNSCRMVWSAPATAPSAGYEIYIATTNNAPVASTTPTVTNNSAGIGVLSGLSPATIYYYWIRSNCSEAKSNWVSGGSFTTLIALNCNGASNGLYPEATFTPTCSGNNEQIASNAYAGEYSNVNVLANKQYTFTSSIASDQITITNAAGTVVHASGATPLIWASGNTAGVIRYFIHTSNCGSQVTNRIRSVKCEDAVTCSTPASFSHTNITSDSVRLQWSALSAAPEGFEVYVTSSNTPPVANSNATAITPGNSTRISVHNGLSASTYYYWWLRTNCGTTKSAWVLGGNFTTLAAMACNSAPYGQYPNTIFTPACTGSNEVIVDNAYAGEFSQIMAAENKQYTFSTSVSGDYVTITNFSGSIVFAHGMAPLTWSTGNMQGLVLYYIHSNANCGAQNTSRLRYIKCTDAVSTTCEPPTQMYTSNITSDSCRINWIDPANPPSGFELYVNASSTAPTANSNPNGWAMSSGVNYYSPLQPATTYHYWVRSVCGDTRSNWASGGTFTTLSALVCNGAIFGLYPEDTITLENNGAPEPVAYQSLASQYSNVIVAANKQYVFTSSIPTDHITITNEDGGVVLASGTTPLTWTSGNDTGGIRFYLHADANCGADDYPRDKFAKAVTLGLGEHSADLFKLYPNPSGGQFTVATGNSVPDMIVIYDSLGRIVYTQHAVSALTTVSANGLSDGIYYVQVRLEGKDYTEKLILKRM